MPQALPIIVAYIGQAYGIWGFFATVATSLAVSDYQRKVARDEARAAWNASLKDRLIMTATTDGPRTRVYGRARNVDGVLFKVPHGTNNELYTFVIGLGQDEVDGIERVYFNDTALVIDGSGNVLRASIYDEGTATSTQNSPNVTGIGTLWTDSKQVKPGMYFATTDTLLYPILQVVDDTHIVLDRPYLGATTTSVAYEVSDVCQYATTPGIVLQETSAVVTQADVGGQVVTTLAAVPTPNTVTATLRSGTGTNMEFFPVTSFSITGQDFTAFGLPQNWVGATCVITYTQVGTSVVSYAKVTKHTGAPGQNLSIELLARGVPASLITGAHNFTGIAALVVTFKYSQDVFPGGVPSVSAVVRGVKVYDPRSPGSPAAWSRNPALCALDWARYTNGGNLALSEVVLSKFIEAANACDVSTTFNTVTTGGKTLSVTEARYFCDTVASTAGDVGQSLEAMVVSMAGRWGWSGGKLSLRAGSWRASVITITEDWISDVGSINIVPSTAPQDTMNIVHPSISDETRGYVINPLPEVPPVGSNPYLALDGEELPVDITFGAITSAHHASDVSKVKLLEGRQGVTVTLPLKNNGVILELFDVVTVVLPQYGWTVGLAKTFEVLGWKFSLTAGPEVVLREVTASNYAVDSTFLINDLHDNTSLPTPWRVTVPLGLGLVAPGTTPGEDFYQLVSHVTLAWTAHTDIGVLQSGAIEVQWVSDLEYAAGRWGSVLVTGASTRYVAVGLSIGMLYYFRIRAVNTLGVRSGWTSVVSVVVPPLNGVGGANVLLNSSFEQDTNSDGVADSWVAYANGTTGAITRSIVGTGGLYNGKTQRVSAAGLGTTTSDRAGCYQIVNVDGWAGEAFTLSTYLKADATGLPSIRLYIDWINAGDAAFANWQRTLAPTTSLMRWSFSGSVPAGAVKAYLYIWMQSRPTAPGASAFEMDAVKLERGSVLTAFSLNDAEAVWSNVSGSGAVDAAITAAQASATAANTALTNIASDSILSPSEKPMVVQDYTAITGEQGGIDAQATAYSITTEKTAYDTAVSTLTSYLGTLSGWNTIPGTDVAIVGTTFRANFADVYAKRQALLNAISAAAKVLANNAQSQADTALANAATADAKAVAAQSSANSALTQLTNIASDSILSPSEKPMVVQDYSVITTEQAGIDAQASATGFVTPCATAKSNYDAAVTALTAYLGTIPGWNTVPGGDVAIVGTTFRSKFADVYTTRQTLLTKIAEVSATLATWATVGGAGKPADNATKNTITYSASAPGSPTDGDIWVDTSVNPNVTRVRVSGAWQVGANYSTNTNQLTDGAGLGTTATWTGVSGTGKPADNATVGATLGTNVSGQINSGNVGGLVADDAIPAAKVSSINADKITAGSIRGISVVGSTLATKGSVLSAACSGGDTTLSLRNTTDFHSSGGTCHVMDSTNDRDVFTYTGKTSTTLTGCSGVLAHTIGATIVPVINNGTGVKSFAVDTLTGELRAWGDRGDGTFAELASVGITSSGSDAFAAIFGVDHSAATARGVWGRSGTNFGVQGSSISGTAIYGSSTSGDGTIGKSAGASTSGIYGENSDAGFGVWGYGLSGVGVKGTSNTGYGGQFDGNATKGNLMLTPRAAPSGKAQGAVYFNSSDSHLYVGNGSAWTQVALASDIPPPPVTCFPAGAQVLLADGTWKPIQHVTTSDLLWGPWGPVTLRKIDRPRLGSRRMLAFADGHRWSEEHTHWTRAQDDSQWWWTYDRKAWLVEVAANAVGGLLDNDTMRTGEDGIEFAHIAGWKRNEIRLARGFTASSRLYLPVTSGSPIIVDGYVCGACVNEAGFDYTKFDWNKNLTDLGVKHGP